MKITFKGDYAMKIILELSLNYNKGLVQMKDISKRQDIPLKYLEQIILILKGAGYVRSKRGPVGGVTLARSPEKIKLGEIIRLMDGTTSPITCVSKTEPSKCADMSRCVFRFIWNDVRNCINNIVDKTTFADIVEKTKALNKETLSYTI